MLTTLTTLFQYSIWNFNHSHTSRERNKNDTKRKGRSQIIHICRWITFFGDTVLLCLKLKILLPLPLKYWDYKRSVYNQSKLYACMNISQWNQLWSICDKNKFMMSDVLG
jgi:hypothetical protein